MIIIGEKINGAIPSVKQAIADRDAELIKQRAQNQTEAGAHFIDCAASTAPELEYDAIYQMGHGSKSMCTAGSPPYILEDGKFRFAVMDDYVRICKLVQTSDCLDMTHLNLCDTYDIDRNERAYHMMAALLRYTTLPMSITALMTAKEDTGMVASRLIDMVSQFIGKENNEPVMIGCVSPISPLAYIKEFDQEYS